MRMVDAVAAATRVARTDVSVKPNSTIFHQGDQAARWYTVLSGVVRLCKYRVDGSRQITRFVFPTETFGLSRPTRITAAEAVAPCTLRQCRRATNSDDSGEQNDPLFCAAVLSALACANASLEVLGRGTATARVAAFLLDVARRTGSGVSASFAIPRADIADFLNLTIYTVSRAMSELTHARLIVSGPARGLRLLDPDALADLAGVEPLDVPLLLRAA